MGVVLDPPPPLPVPGSAPSLKRPLQNGSYALRIRPTNSELESNYLHHISMQVLPFLLIIVEVAILYTLSSPPLSNPNLLLFNHLTPLKIHFPPTQEVEVESGCMCVDRL